MNDHPHKMLSEQSMNSELLEGRTALQGTLHSRVSAQSPSNTRLGLLYQARAPWLLSRVERTISQVSDQEVLIEGESDISVESACRAVRETSSASDASLRRAVAVCGGKTSHVTAAPSATAQCPRPSSSRTTSPHGSLTT
jgi:hypothetical protein